MRPLRKPNYSALVLSVLALVLSDIRLWAIPDLRFDVVTFCCGCSNQMLCQTQFDHLNFPTVNGHYLAMGSDTQRSNLLASGNLLAIYYNNFSVDYTTNTTPAQEAAAIDQYATTLFTNTGPKPNWLVLNEISASLWPGNQTYRTWVEDVMQLLKNTYGYSIILYAPFANPGNNQADWEAVTANAYIGVENYLSGQEIAAENFSVSWCGSQYDGSIVSYNSVGVPASRLILGEHFGQTLSNTGYGRAGVSSNSWDSAINARSQSVPGLGFAGFIGYDWGGDDMDVSETEMVHYEDTYAANPLPANGTLTAPFPAQQPQNASAPPGSIVTFTVYPAGDAPMTFQWEFDGSVLPGATNSILNLTNIGPANAGSYAILMTNAAGSSVSSNAVLTVQVPPPLAFDPFANATNYGGTTYPAGANLIGQTNGQAETWFQAGPASALTNQPILQSGSLDIPGLLYSSGNRVAFGGGGGMAARFQIGTNGSGINSGTVYYSFALKLTNLADLSSSGVFWAGFNDSTGSQTTTPNVVAARIYTRAATGGFNFGLSKASSTTSDWQWDTAAHTANETIFVVGSYTFNSASTNDDVSQLWINPPPTAFGTANPPAATLTAGSGPDITPGVISSFLIMNRSSAEPAGGLLDELRVGASWASVTPPAGSAPTLSAAQIAGSLILSWPTNGAGFLLYSTTNLASPNSWQAVGSPVAVVGGSFVVSNSMPAGGEYFRLEHP